MSDDGRHRRIEINGIWMHIAKQGTGPLVLLLHGFPEIWYSWRHQMSFLVNKGYHVAPDMRGLSVVVVGAVAALACRSVQAR